MQNIFIAFRVTIFFLFDGCCAHRGDFCEWSDCDFSSANSFCKHSCILLLSARTNLTLLLRRQQWWGN